MLYNIKNDEGSFLFETTADTNTIKSILKLLKSGEIEGQYMKLIDILDTLGYIGGRRIPVVIND